MYIYTWIDVYIFTHIPIDVFTHTFIYIHTYMYIQVCIYTYICFHRSKLARAFSTTHALTLSAFLPTCCSSFLSSSLPAYLSAREIHQRATEHEEMRRERRCQKVRDSLLHFECQCISISHFNLLGLFSTERGKRDLEH